MRVEPTPRISPRIAARLPWIAWAWAALIFVACWLPADRMPADESIPSVPNMDKAVHFGMFAVFAALAMVTGTLRARPLRIVMAALLIAVVTEIGQGTRYVGRDPDAWDVAADTLGALVGVGVGAAARSLRDRGRT